MWGTIIALLSGMLMSIQGIFNTAITKETSLWVCTGWVQLTAFVVCVFMWFVTGRQAVGGLFAIDSKYMLFTGVMGALITITVVKSMASLGPAGASMLIVIAQIGMSYAVELLGIFGAEKQPFMWRKVIGLVIAAAGIVLFQWKK
ncbi:MAG: DMT family transporter [Lachnospiraceae bacterium]|nr:DMT family transporter [Lachnospiraceae bacterium]